MGSEIGAVQPGYQGKDLLGRPAPTVYDDEVLADRFRQLALECFLHPLGVEIVLPARDGHGPHRISDPYSPKDIL
jgi:hypothetical protein